MKHASTGKKYDTICIKFKKYADLDTLTSQICLKFSAVIPILKIRKS